MVELAIVPCGRVHRAENVGDDLVRVGAVTVAEPLDGGGEHALSVEDVGVLGKEAEDQPGHEVVNVGPALCRSPVGEIGRAHVCTPVPNAHLVCRLLREKKNTNSNNTGLTTATLKQQKT